LNLTIRNIAENVIKKIRILSQMKKRSLNNEILLILENGVQEEVKHLLKIKRKISRCKYGNGYQGNGRMTGLQRIL
jgi:plasmid stability protein